MYILTFGLMLGKVLLSIIQIFLFILLFKYRKNDFMTKKSITVFGHKFELNGKETNNPITALIGDSGTSTKSYD